MSFTVLVFIYAILPTLVYLVIGLYILTLEQKKGPGYKSLAVIYFISVPSLVLIGATLTFSMNYMTGKYEAGTRAPGYELYKFLVLKDIIPRSGLNLDENQDRNNKIETTYLNENDKLNKNKVEDEYFKIKDLSYKIPFKKINHFFMDSAVIDTSSNIKESLIVKFEVKNYPHFPTPNTSEVKVYSKNLYNGLNQKAYSIRFLISDKSGNTQTVDLEIMEKNTKVFILKINDEKKEYERSNIVSHKGELHNFLNINNKNRPYSTGLYFFEKNNNHKLGFLISKVLTSGFNVEIDDVFSEYYERDKGIGTSLYNLFDDNNFSDELFKYVNKTDNDEEYILVTNLEDFYSCNKNKTNNVCESHKNSYGYLSFKSEIDFYNLIFQDFLKKLKDLNINEEVDLKNYFTKNKKIYKSIHDKYYEYDEETKKQKRKRILLETKSSLEKKFNILDNKYSFWDEDNPITLSARGNANETFSFFVLESEPLTAVTTFLTFSNDSDYLSYGYLTTENSLSLKFNITEKRITGDFEKNRFLPGIDYARYTINNDDKSYKFYIYPNKNNLKTYEITSNTWTNPTIYLKFTEDDIKNYFLDLEKVEGKCLEEKNCHEYIEIILDAKSPLESGYYKYGLEILKKLNKIEEIKIASLEKDNTIKTNTSKKEKNKSLTKQLETNEKYYALVIGNNNYEYLEKLDAAENDAVVIADVLKNKYGFEVDLLLNADQETTVDTLFSITEKLKNNDNLLIYYAGHGELDKAENRGYWLPVDASYEKRSKWISNQTIVDRIKATKAKHVLLVADSCFSGTLMRSGTNLQNQESIDEKYIERLKNKKTRLVITSGGNEPVVDSVGGDHSLFALKFIDTLKNSDNVINSQILFENIRRYVVANADQTPERAMVHKTGHDGGDFLFFPK